MLDSIFIAMALSLPVALIVFCVRIQKSDRQSMVFLSGLCCVVIGLPLGHYATKIDWQPRPGVIYQGFPVPRAIVTGDPPRCFIGPPFYWVTAPSVASVLFIASSAIGWIVRWRREGEA